MSANTARHPPVRTPSGLLAYTSFAIMIGGWAAFAIALVASQQTLDDVWTSIRDLPLVEEAAVWLLGFPFLIGLAVWQAPWDEALRLIAISALAAVFTYMFVPRNRKG